MLPKDYNGFVGFPTMVINALQNKRDGPGGSARRLHQPISFSDGYPENGLNHLIYGGETGSTCVVKSKFLLGIVPPLSGYFYKCKR